MPEEIETISYPVSVKTTEAGEPYCPHCGLVMVSDDGAMWCCPEWAPVIRAVYGALAATVDGAVLPPLSGS